MISELFPEEKKRLFQLEQQLFYLENGNKQINPSDIYLGLNEMNQKFEYLEKLVQQENKGRRDDYRRRLQHLKSSHQHIKAGIDNFCKANLSAMTGTMAHHTQRQQLFYGNNSNVDSMEQRQDNEYYDIETAQAENQSLSNSSNMVNSYISLGQEALGELLSQKDRLKGIQRKVFDIMSYLGISNTVMKTVERRDTIDRFIVFGGMILISLLLIFVIFYWRK